MLEMFLDRINRIERSGSMKKKIMFVALAVVAMAWCPTAYADEGSDTVGWTPLAVDIWVLGRTNAHVIAIPPRDWNVAGLSLGSWREPIRVWCADKSCRRIRQVDVWCAGGVIELRRGMLRAAVWCRKWIWRWHGFASWRNQWHRMQCRTVWLGHADWCIQHHGLLPWCAVRTFQYHEQRRRGAASWILQRAVGDLCRRAKQWSRGAARCVQL